jgi:hypothetical protein
MPDSSNRGEPLPVTPERRRKAREYAKSLVYVELGNNNGGIALNFSEHGIAVQAANEVTDDVISQIRFQLPHSLLWIETAGRVVWTSDSRTLAAIEFTGLSQKSLDQIRQWLEYESKVDIGAMQSAPKPAGAKSAKPVTSAPKVAPPSEAPRTIPKLTSALAQMLAKDPSYAKMEEQLRDSSDIPSFEELARRDAERQAQRATKQEVPPEPVAEISLEPVKPAPEVIPPPPPSAAIEPPVMAPPPASLPADFERTRIYEPPPRTRVRHAPAEAQVSKPAKPREPVQDIPIDPESVEAQEEIRKIIASGEEARSRTILYRLQKAPLSLTSDVPSSEVKSSASAPKRDSSPQAQKNSSLNQKSALSRPAVRIGFQGPDVPFARAERRNWTLPILLGILVVLLAILVWLGIRDSSGGGALTPRSAEPSKTVASDAAASPAIKDLQIEVVDSKGRRRIIPASAPAQTPASTPAEPKPPEH